MTHFNWSPKIGDPTIGGWVTVVLYLLAAGSCWITARELVLEDIASNERRAWWAISALFLALGINKQLDLQSALTETGRVLAHYQGWFEQRQLVQLAFIALVAIICLIAAIALLLWTRSAPTPTRLALIGTSMVLGFVLICAASFHPRRPIYWPKNFGAPLELDTRNERNQLGPLCKPVASSECLMARSLLICLHRRRPNTSW
jgi:hypothetical protein